MRPDLIAEFRHCPTSATPLYLRHADVQKVAAHVRSQLGHSEEDLVVDVDRLTRVRAVRVNGISYELEWCLDVPVHDEQGAAVFGVCEVDSQVPDCALININAELIGSREELLRSTCFHEAGHGIIDAPGWIWNNRNAAGDLFGASCPDQARSVFRATTPNEAHLSATPQPNTPPNFQEIRANEFMGSVCAPRKLLAPEFRRRCEQVGLDHRIFGVNTGVPLFASGSDSGATSVGAEPDLVFDRCEINLRLEVAIRRLAVDFGLTPRFIEVRLKRYELLRNEFSLA